MTLTKLFPGTYKLKTIDREITIYKSLYMTGMWAVSGLYAGLTYCNSLRHAKLLIEHKLNISIN